MDFERFVLCAGLFTTLLIGLSVLSYFLQLSWWMSFLVTGGGFAAVFAAGFGIWVAVDRARWRRDV